MAVSPHRQSRCLCSGDPVWLTVPRACRSALPDRNGSRLRLGFLRSFFFFLPFFHYVPSRLVVIVAVVVFFFRLFHQTPMFYIFENNNTKLYTYIIRYDYVFRGGNNLYSRYVMRLIYIYIYVRNCRSIYYCIYCRVYGPRELGIIYTYAIMIKKKQKTSEKFDFLS